MPKVFILRSLPSSAARKALLQPDCHRRKGPGRLTHRVGHHYRFTTISALADRDNQRDFSQEPHSFALGLQTAAAMAEDVHACSIRKAETAHVLHDAQNRNLNLLKERHAFTDHTQGGLLRGGDDDTSIQRHRLAQGQLGIAGARPRRATLLGRMAQR